MTTTHLASVELVTDSIPRFPSKGKKSPKRRFFPFKQIKVAVTERHICPFCEKELDGFTCSCNDFKTKLKKLQESHHDFKHKSELHYGIFRAPYVHTQSTDSLSVELLGDEEIKGLDPNVWDEATRVSGSGYSYLIANASYQGNKCTFLCKNVQTKKVYLCSTNEFKVDAKKIYLGIQRKKTVSHGLAPNGGIRYGNYHFEPYWDDIATFDKGWEQFSRLIQAV